MLKNYTKEFKYNLKLASPVIMGMLGHTLVGFVDNVMVGQLGTAELAAVSLGNSFLFIAISLGIGFSTAITPLVAESHAANEFLRGKLVFKNGVVLCTILGFMLTLAVFLCQPILSYMGQPLEVVKLAIPYLSICTISLFPIVVFQGIKQFSDGLSVTKYPMYATLISNLLNVVLNYFLIFGKFGFPKLGIEGAAYSTLISRILMFFILVFILSINSKTKQYLFGFFKSSIDKSMMKKIFSLGFPSALQMLFEVAIFVSAVWLSGLLGKNHQAANQIALNLSSMTYMVAMGLSVACTIRVGNYKGKQNFAELRRISFSLFLLGLILATAFALFYVVFNTSLPKLYLDSGELSLDNLEVIKIAGNLLLISAVFQISDSIQIIALGALRGLQDVKVPTILTFISYWIIGFPISYFLGKESVLSSVGIWIGLLSGLTIASILLYIRFNYLTKRLILQPKQH